MWYPASRLTLERSDCSGYPSDYILATWWACKRPLTLMVWSVGAPDSLIALVTRG